MNDMGIGNIYVHERHAKLLHLPKLCKSLLVEQRHQKEMNQLF